MKTAILSSESVDRKILSSLGKTPMRFNKICSATKIEWRAVDRGLQRLRRAGKIRLVTGPNGGWILGSA